MSTIKAILDNTPKPFILQDTMAGKSTTIAFVWDFDKTLTPNYSEAPLFKHYNVQENNFWQEVNELKKYYVLQGIHNVSEDTTYLNHILTYVEKRVFKNLTNTLLRNLGAKIPLYTGVTEFFTRLSQHIATNPIFQKYDIVLEHYIVSTGLYEMIAGSAIGQLVDGIWANEFIENPAAPNFLTRKIPPSKKRSIQQVGYVIDNTTKTRALYEINKGVNKISGLHVNNTIAYEERRIPFSNIVYIADGPSDIPCFSAVNQYGGTSYGVYKPGSQKEFEQAYELYQQGRIQFFSEANYTDGSQTSLALIHILDTIAKRIVREKQQEAAPPIAVAQPLPQHINE